MENILKIINGATAKLTIPLTFALVIIFVLKRMGKSKDKNHFVNIWNKKLRKIHKQLGIALVIFGLIHGIASQQPVLWGIVCFISTVLLGLNYMLRKNIKNFNWMKIHRALTVIILLTLVLHLAELEKIEQEHHDENYSYINQNEESIREPTSIKGISVLMEDDMKERAETVTITMENGELAIQDKASSGC